MIRWLLNRLARAFAKRYDYDTSYMIEVNHVSTGAGLRLAAFPLISQYRGPKQAQRVWAGGLLASTLEGDCGPCAQLCIDMALEAGIAPEDVTRCLNGEAASAGDFGLGFRFAMASIRDTLEVDDLRAEITVKYGQKAVIAAAFASATGRFYPVFKRGLGHGKVCQRLQVEGANFEVVKAA